MYQVTKIVTNDGKMFNTEKDAKRYLDKQYANLVCAIASQLVSLGKYQAIKQFLDEHSELFEEMLALKRELNEETTE